MDCLPIELCLNEIRTYIVSSIYRTRGLSIGMFIERFSELFNTLNHDKEIYICEDLKIDLLNINYINILVYL